ncbi:unnamed protein product [Phaeothamnion confervicola]
MDRGRKAMPVANKACHARYMKQCQEHHRSKLASMKPTVDNTTPASMRNSHLKQNAKKQQLMEDRYAQIERDNRILLEKMSSIMRDNAGGVDNRNDTAKYAKSLNREHRKRELQKITKENQRILHAIQSSEPVYDHVKWEEEARRHEEYMRNICEFPVTLHAPGFGFGPNEVEEGLDQAALDALRSGAYRSALSQR